MVCCHWPQASSFTPGIVCGPAYGRDIIDRPARACFGWMRRLPWPMRNSIAKRAQRCGHRWALLAEWIAPELRGE